jgi:hypothetical protein
MCLDGEEWGTSGISENHPAGPCLALSIRGRLIRRMAMKALKRDAAMTVATDASWMRQIIGIVRRLGPYAAIEIILPGGSLVVLLMWFFRQHGDVRSFGRMVRTWLFAAIGSLRHGVGPERANC